MAITIERARAAKAAAKKELAHVPGVSGFGLTKVGADYALKLNLSEALPPGVKVPQSIDGVPVRVEVVGTIRKRS